MTMIITLLTYPPKETEKTLKVLKAASPMVPTVL